MAHYAKLNSKNIVISVFVGRDESDTSENWEEVYSNLFGKTCKRTSYNTRGGIHYTDGEPSEDQSKAFRKNYAGKGFKYYVSHDGFAPPKPYASWTLNSSTLLWESPIERPSDDNAYLWDEDTNEWDVILR
jgi:hypothetical protein